jgi:hypothetical protein
MVMAESYPGFYVQGITMGGLYIIYTIYNTVYRNEAGFVGNQIQVDFDSPLPVIQSWPPSAFDVQPPKSTPIHYSSIYPICVLKFT